jgi:hypothetical protein
MQYAVEMGSGFMIYIPSFIQIGSGIQGRDTQTKREQGDNISVLVFFQNKKSRLMRKQEIWQENIMESNHTGDIPLDGRIILKSALKEITRDVKLLTEDHYHQCCEAMYTVQHHQQFGGTASECMNLQSIINQKSVIFIRTPYDTV